jgi:hypothetical protein
LHINLAPAPCRSPRRRRRKRKANSPGTHQELTIRRADSSHSESPTDNRSGHRELRVSACIPKSQKCPPQHNPPFDICRAGDDGWLALLVPLPSSALPLVAAMVTHARRSATVGTVVLRANCVSESKHPDLVHHTPLAPWSSYAVYNRTRVRSCLASSINSTLISHSYTPLNPFILSVESRLAVSSARRRRRRRRRPSPHIHTQLPTPNHIVRPIFARCRLHLVPLLLAVCPPHLPSKRALSRSRQRI